MDHWSELRTALMVARLGTVSAAADALGVHRATVNRHIETLEAALAVKLFQRHARGYTLTDAGRDMLDVTNRADEMFADLEGRSRSRTGQLSGELIVTALSFAAPLVMPAMRAFHLAHPDIIIEFQAAATLARLEYGEAHVAVRAGARPVDPDYVVLPFRSVRFGVYASADYVARAGRVEGERIEGHRFIGIAGRPSRAPFSRWMERHVPPDALALRTTDQQVILGAVRAGLGLGFLSEPEIAAHPDLVEVIAPRDDWTTHLWLVTHVDLHRTAKVQEFLRFLKDTRP